MKEEGALEEEVEVEEKKGRRRRVLTVSGQRPGA